MRATDGKIHDKGNKSAPISRSRRAVRPTSAAPATGPSTSQPPTATARCITDVYSVAPAGIFVPPNSRSNRRSDLAGVPVSVGFQSGSHYSTVQALEQYLKPEQIH